MLDTIFLLFVAIFARSSELSKKRKKTRIRLHFGSIPYVSRGRIRLKYLKKSISTVIIISSYVYVMSLYSFCRVGESWVPVHPGQDTSVDPQPRGDVDCVTRSLATIFSKQLRLDRENIADVTP